MFTSSFLRAIGDGFAHDFANLRDLVNTHERVHFGHEPGEFVAEPLRETAGNDDGLAAMIRLAQLDGFKNRVHALLLRGVNEGAGVDDEGVGLRSVIRDFDTALEQRAEHDFGVHEIFGAAERNEADAEGFGTGFFFCHRRKSLAEFWCEAISEAPITNIQTPEKRQASSSKRCWYVRIANANPFSVLVSHRGFLKQRLVIGAWSLELFVMWQARSWKPSPVRWWAWPPAAHWFPPADRAVSAARHGRREARRSAAQAIAGPQRRSTCRKAAAGCARRPGSRRFCRCNADRRGWPGASDFRNGRPR